MHSQGIIHADIKPENILLSNSILQKKFSHSFDVKLVDFGSSCYFTDTLTTYIQSKAYRAPEVIVGGKYNEKIDIWSVGCIFGEMVNMKPLFAGSSEKDQLKKIFKSIGTPLLDNWPGMADLPEYKAKYYFLIQFFKNKFIIRLKQSKFFLGRSFVN